MDFNVLVARKRKFLLCRRKTTALGIFNASRERVRTSRVLLVCWWNKKEIISFFFVGKKKKLFALLKQQKEKVSKSFFISSKTFQ
jgi:hypothetical protein